MVLSLEVPLPRVWLEVKTDRPFSAEAPKSVASLPLRFPASERPSAFRRRPLCWLVAVGAVGWWLVSGDLPCLTILCLEDVLAPDSVGGCVGRLRGCLSTARM